MTSNDDTPASGPNVQPSEFSFRRAMQAIRSGDWSEAPCERELLDSFKSKGMTSTVWGPFFIPDPKEEGGAR